MRAAARAHMIWWAPTSRASGDAFVSRHQLLKGSSHADLHFQVGNEEGLTSLRGRPCGQQAAEEPWSLDRHRRDRAGQRAAPQLFPRGDRGSTRCRGIPALAHEENRSAGLKRIWLNLSKTANITESDKARGIIDTFRHCRVTHVCSQIAPA